MSISELSEGPKDSEGKKKKLYHEKPEPLPNRDLMGSESGLRYTQVAGGHQ